MGVAACVAGLVMYPFFDRGYTHGEGITDAVASQARVAFVITVLQLAFGFVSQVPGAIMTAHRDFLVRNAISIGGLGLRLALIAVWLRAHASLTVLAWITALQMLVEFAIAVVVVRRKYPGTRLGLEGFDKKEIRSIVAFSAYVLLLAIGYKLLFMTSPLILGKFRSPAVVTAFGIGISLVLYLTDFILAIGAVAMPTAVKLKVENRERELADMFLQWSKIAFSLGLVAGLYLCVLGTDFIREWIREPGFDAAGAGEVNMILMISHFVFLPVRGVGLPILMGLGKPERATVAFVLSGLLNIAIGLALVRPFGMVGVALGIAVPDVLFALYVLVLVCRELGVSWRRYASYVGSKALIGSVPVLGFLFLLKRTVPLDGRVPVILCGVASTAVFALVWVLYVYRGDPYVDAGARLKRLFASRKPAP
jgi:O-antigen/teichoic acid export membrane protein